MRSRNRDLETRNPVNRRSPLAPDYWWSGTFGRGADGSAIREGRRVAGDDLTLAGGATWAAGRQGKPCVSFDGSTGYAQRVALPAPGSGGGLIAVVLRGWDWSNDPYLFSMDGYATDSTQSAFRLEQFGGLIYCTTGNGATSTSTYDPAWSPSVGRWYCVVARWTPTKHQIWVDGRLRVDGTPGVFGYASTAPVQAGACEAKGDGSSRRFHGDVADAMVWLRGDVNPGAVSAELACGFPGLLRRV